MSAHQGSRLTSARVRIRVGVELGWKLSLTDSIGLAPSIGPAPASSSI